MTRFENIEGIHKLWEVGQKPMTKVIRWTNFSDYGQTLTEHTVSIDVLHDWVMSHYTDMKIDRVLLGMCVKYHDFGEALLQQDVLYDLKKDDDEVAEYEVFEAFTRDMQPLAFRVALLEGFLLQFCIDANIKAFPEKVQVAIKTLQQKKWPEAVFFQFIQRLDYLFSALSGYKRDIRNDEETMYDHTVKRQVGEIDRLVAGFESLTRVWKPEVRAGFLKRCSEVV